jgi:hypothetical protein
MSDAGAGVVIFHGDGVAAVILGLVVANARSGSSK